MDLTTVLTYAFFFVAGLMIFAVGIPFLFVMSKENKQAVPPRQHQSNYAMHNETYALSTPYYAPAREYVQQEYVPAEMYVEEPDNNYSTAHTGPKYEIVNSYSLPAQNNTKLKTWESNWN